MGQAKVEREGSNDCRLLAQYKTAHCESHEPTNQSSKCRGQIFRILDLFMTDMFLCTEVFREHRFGHSVVSVNDP